MPGRELIMCSPTGSISTGSTATLTMTISEPGRLRLSNLVLSAAFGTAASAASPNIIDQLNMSSALVNGAIELVRGRGSVVAPAGAFSAYRGVNNIPLPDIHVQAGDTFAVTLGSESTNSGAIDCSMSCEFSPDNVRESVMEPARAAVYAGSDVVELDAGGAGSATFTADEAGTFSLASMQFRAYLDLAAAGAAAGDWANGESQCEISSIQLPTGNELLLGQGSNVCNGSYFAAGRRSYSWYEGGAIRLSGGDTIVYTLTNTGADTLNASFGGRFYPDKFRGYDGCK